MVKHKHQRQDRRTTKGQGLVEASCGTVILVTVFVGLLMLGLNAYSVLTTDTKLRLICAEAAKVREEHTYFLGMKRVDFTPEDADHIAKDFAVRLATNSGIAIDENSISFDIDESTDQATTTCTVTLDRFKLPYGGGMFPSFIGREVSATVANMSVPAPAIVGFNGDSKEHGQIAVQVPCYGGAVAVKGVHDPIRDLQRGTSKSLEEAPLGPIQYNRSFGIGVNEDGLVISGPKDEDGNPASNPKRRWLKPRAMRNTGGYPRSSSRPR